MLQDRGQKVKMSGDAGCTLAWHIQGVFNRRERHCIVAEGKGRDAHLAGCWIGLASAFESAGMQRGRQVKHTMFRGGWDGQTTSGPHGSTPALLAEGAAVPKVL